jgi:hypothetical protein
MKLVYSILMTDIRRVIFPGITDVISSYFGFYVRVMQTIMYTG